MSVYIRIKQARLNHQVNIAKPVLYIISKDKKLIAEGNSDGNYIYWNHSFISSSQQKNIQFDIKDLTNQEKSYGKTELFYSSLRSYPERQYSQYLTLDNGGRLFIDIYYTQRQNFLGDISFYSHQNTYKSNEDTTTNYSATKAQSRRVYLNPPKVSAAFKPLNGSFFCCGDQIDDKQYTLEQEHLPISNSPFSKQLANKKLTQAVQFYQGPCKSRNLFSCCDAGVQNQSFNIIEQYYRDK